MIYYFLNTTLLTIAAFLLSVGCIRNDSVRWGAVAVVIIGAIALGYWLIRKGKRVNRTVWWVTFVALLAAEVLFRLLLQGAYTEDAFRFPRPYFMFSGQPDAKVNAISQMQHESAVKEDIQLNALGFRGEIPTMPKAGKELRIFLIGGSTVFNGSPYSNTISALLEKAFHNDGHAEVRVYNFGIVSAVSGQELALVVHLLTRYQPDIILVYDGGNDIMCPFYYDPRPGYPYNFYVFERGFDLLRGKQQTFFQQVSSIFLKSRLISAVSGRNLQKLILSTQDVRRQVGAETQSWEQLITDQYLSNIRVIALAGKGLGYRTACILQPLAQFKNPKTEKEKKLIESQTFCEYTDRQYQRIRIGLSQLQRTVPNEMAMFIDLSMVMSDRPEQTYWDFIHTNNSGNQYLAAQIYGRIRNWCLKAPINELTDNVKLK